MKERTVSDLLAEKTLQFLSSVVELGGQGVLEVGCGEGDVSLALANAGARVIGVDVDEESISRARERGVDARCVDCLSFEEGPFDVVLFTRSLHHIRDLHAAVAHSFELLDSDGVLILEEFDRHHTDAATARWYYDTRFLLTAMGLSDSTDARVTDPLEKWREDHEHDPPLHGGEAMTEAVERSFGSVRVERTAYLFRSICADLPAEAYELARAIHEVETGLIHEGRILPNGLRVVAHKSV